MTIVALRHHRSSTFFAFFLNKMAWLRVILQVFQSPVDINMLVPACRCSDSYDSVIVAYFVTSFVNTQYDI